jgi:HNH endonuclease
MSHLLAIDPSERFGRLVVIGPGPRGREFRVCLCACGAQREVRIYELRYGKTRSCGCLKRETSAANSRRHVANNQDDFWSRVQKGENCWVWLGGKSVGGYGKASWENRTVAAHRLAWELTFGAIPKGLLVCHHCDNPPCVRPDHLFLGTPLANTRDMWNKGRARPVQHGRPFPLEHRYRGRGEKNGAAKLTATQVATIREVHAAGGSTQRALASRFGVCLNTIRNVLSGATWR